MPGVAAAGGPAAAVAKTMSPKLLALLRDTNGIEDPLIQFLTEEDCDTIEVFACFADTLAEVKTKMFDPVEAMKNKNGQLARLKQA